MRTITNPADNSARSSAVIRTELQALETEIANTSSGHDHDGSDSKAILPASLPSAIDATKIADGSVSNTEFQYLNGVTSAIQTQLDGKAATTRKLDDFGTPDDNTDLNANTTNHGLVVKATAPTSGLINVVGIANGETAYTNKALFDAISPSTQAFGDSAATGSATVAARRDHKHAMPSSPTVPVKATGAEINTGTDDDKFATAKALADSNLGIIAQEEAWTAFTPSWTNLTVGSGTNEGYYAKIGKTVHFRVMFIFAADSSVSGDITLTLPVAARTFSSSNVIGLVRMSDIGVGIYAGVIASGGQIRCQNSSGTYLMQTVCSSTVPFTWTTTDEIEITGIYEAS